MQPSLNRLKVLLLTFLGHRATHIIQCLNVDDENPLLRSILGKIDSVNQLAYEFLLH